MITTKTGRIAEFIIGGVQYNEHTAFAIVPDKFRELFDGHSFKDFKVFSRALFYANCCVNYADSMMHGHTVNAYRNAMMTVLETDRD